MTIFRTIIDRIFGDRKLSTVDLEAELDARARQANQPLHWRTSIVDLMKLLDLDSGEDNRHRLADELCYLGDENDTVKMNTWLHKEVMRKLAANGGRVPDELRGD